MTALFVAHFVPLARYVERRTGDRALGEEIGAEVLVVAWERMPSEHPNVTAWLFTVASNKLRDHWRKTKRDVDLAAVLAERTRDTDEPGDVLDTLAVRQAVYRLPPREREVVMLTYWDGLAAADVAAVLDCSVSSVWTTLHRARTRMRDELSNAPQGGEGHARTRV